MKERRFAGAIVRKPCPEMVGGMTSAGLGTPDFIAASEQHRKYVEALEDCGLIVTVLEADSRFPDSVFVEDVAVCTPECAIITLPGAVSRKGETEGMDSVLSEFYRDIRHIRFPGTLEAGDVLMVGSHYFIGLSERTNREGAEQLIRILEEFGMTGCVVPLTEMLHLKTGISYLENNTLLVVEEFYDLPDFQQFIRILVPVEEAYAANAVWVNGTILMPDGFPLTRAKLIKAGYRVTELAVSEFRKLDGGLSCLSLRLEVPSVLSSFRSGLNCAQTVVDAFANKLGFDRETGIRISTGFGGGMGRLQETCGVVTGAFMVIGFYQGLRSVENAERKSASYDRIREFNSRFTDVHQSTNCRILLGADLNSEEGRLRVSKDHLHEAICEPCILTALTILNDLIK